MHWLLFDLLKCSARWPFTLALLISCLAAHPARAQSVNPYPNNTGGAITDNNCGTAAQITRTFTVPSLVVLDVDLGVLVSHTYRSDLRITLQSPAGTTVTVMTWTGNVQSGDNLNDRFDDEAANPIGSHDPTVNESITPTLPNYLHQFRPSNLLSAFDGQNAAGVWTLVVCDAVGSDIGNFIRADLFITAVSLSMQKSSSLVSDPVNGGTNPKIIPGAVMRYCVLVANNGAVTHSNIALSDPLPAGLTYVAGSLRSGTSCGGAVTVEDDDATDGGEGDPVVMSFTGTAIAGSQAALTAGGSIAFVYSAAVQ